MDLTQSNTAWPPPI